MTTEVDNIQYRDDCVKWTWVTVLIYVAPDQTDTLLYQPFTLYLCYSIFSTFANFKYV